MDPSAANPDTIYQILLFFLGATNLLGGLATFIQAVKGRPAVKRDEFDEHKSQVFARLKGINEKVDEAEAKREQQNTEIMKELREIAKVLGVHEGRLEVRGGGHS